MFRQGVDFKLAPHLMETDHIVYPLDIDEVPDLILPN